MKILVINGSPRKGGNTEILLDTMITGAQEAGATISSVELRSLNVSPCRACDSCKRTGKCIQNDDMHDLILKMKESDVWILGTPVYWWGPTAQLKAFIDRWYGVSRDIFKNRRFALVIPLGSSNPKTAQHVLGMFEDISAYLGMKQIGTLLAPGVYERGEANTRSDLLEEATKLGRSIAS
ncbi:flavodoxin family protein [Candidatus Thorarchaeota archaeon]|jgi:multimeric flavodoxin WrbA|nr:flavodoxin family protein [Candidatus Thorarchaeota archaeon]TFG99710.1 MAG: flavodoxin family protein [Candidatus Thorarchaeota archaeon]